MQKEAEAIQEIEDRHHKKVKRLENRLEKTINNLEDKHGTPIRNIRQQSLEGAKRVDELDEKITNLKNRGPTIHLPLISELRQYVAKRKVPAVTQWAENIDEQIIIFGRHNAILDELNNNLDDSAVYDGNTNDKVAEQMKKDYRNGDLKVFIGQIQACGEGIELVKGSRTNIAFIEAPWNPQVVYQAEGRAYARLGDWSGINSNYFICEDTVDSDIFDTLDKKASIFNNVVDDKQAEGDFDTSSVQEEVLEKMKQRQGV
jgi:SNF2 family DNA or RNA helicase